MSDLNINYKRHWGTGDTDSLFTGLYIVWALFSIGCIGILWALGIHLGFGGSSWGAKYLWHDGHLYEWDYPIPGPYTGTTWPVIDSVCFILPGGLVVLALLHKSAHVLTKVMAR